MESLKKKYGLLTGIAMVVGIVIGSGVFFKAGKVLSNTNGDLGTALFAWLIGGLIMVVSAYCFGLVGAKIEKVNGAVDYVEVATNKKVGYALGWYFATIYYPILVSILAFLSMLYLFTLLGLGSLIMGAVFWLCVVVLICLSFLMNTIAPRVAGYYQVSTTFIKMIPIFIIAIVGTIIGLINGNTAEAFKAVGDSALVKSDFGSAILATIFAYEGWVVATSINAELKDSKKNLPRALVIGTLIVICSYLLYYLGLSSLIPNTNDIIGLDSAAPLAAMNGLIGKAGEFIFNILVIISCLGTLNGLTMGCCRGLFSLATRGQGPKPLQFANLHPKYNTSVKSSIAGLVLSLAFAGLWYVAMQGWLPLGSMDEVSIAVVYISYVAVYIWIMKECTELNKFKRFVMPSLAILASVLLTFASTGLFQLVTLGSFAKMEEFLVFSGISFLSVFIGLLFYKDNPLQITDQILKKE
ncbi:MAG: APC family permease [Bacilli bacterium]|jgi:APA family basic amino acid/polyamine antiporter|nr:APC family permease [Bacilli bacterium]MDD4056262.1 APC family permease [Bacilli bacterium]MDY0209495.1 APC family permease [Bacilli bacterium]